MADIHDFMHAERETTDAMRALEGQLSDLSDDQAIAGVLGTGLLAVALAVRELAVRFDFVLRDEARR